MTDTTPPDNAPDDDEPDEETLRRQAEAVERVIAQDPGALLAALNDDSGGESQRSPGAADSTGHDASANPHAAGRKRYIAVPEGTLFVDVPVPPWQLPIPQWNSTHQAPGWELVGADLQMPGGRPQGYFVYQRARDSRRQRVGVRWDVERELPETMCLHETKGEPAKNRERIDADILELDALARATALMSINSFIGANVVTLDGENTILQAAGLGIPRVDLDEKRQTRR
jgi:hypothetical protein